MFRFLLPRHGYGDEYCATRDAWQAGKVPRFREISCGVIASQSTSERRRVHQDDTTREFAPPEQGTRYDDSPITGLHRCSLEW
jgi:hypothetical protein